MMNSKKSFLRKSCRACGALILLCTLFSCEMFTTSLGKNSVRDQSEVVKKASASELADMAAGIDSANPATARAIMDALSGKADDLKNLSKEQKEAILNLALDATVPMGDITKITEDLLDKVGDPNFTVSATEAKSLVEDIFDSVTEFNTTALNTLLNDPDTLKTVDPSTLANAAVASIAQIAKTSNIDISNIEDVDFTGGTVDSIVAIFLPSKPAGQTSAEFAKAEKDLKTALTAVKVLLGKSVEVGGKDIQRTDTDDVKLLGMIPLKDVLKGMGGKES